MTMPPFPTADAVARPAQPDPHQLLVQQHYVSHASASALARWRTEPVTPASAGPAAARLRWQQQRQQHYLAWLQAGGFAQ
ncbi:MAG: hypothetical protein ACEQSK_07210 [Sphingomonadaceae bacterium]